MKNYPLGEQPAQRESAGRAGELPGQDTDMLDATALCGHNRVKSVHMVFIEPQSESQGPGEGRPPLASLRDLCRVSRRGGCADPWRVPWVQSTASRWLPRF